jgi:hypothetical protein
MQSLHILEFLSLAIRCHVHHLQSVENGAHGTEKLLLKLK